MAIVMFTNLAFTNWGNGAPSCDDNDRPSAGPWVWSGLEPLPLGSSAGLGPGGFSIRLWSTIAGLINRVNMRTSCWLVYVSVLESTSIVGMNIAISWANTCLWMVATLQWEGSRSRFQTTRHEDGIVNFGVNCSMIFHVPVPGFQPCQYPFLKDVGMLLVQTEM